MTTFHFQLVLVLVDVGLSFAATINSVQIKGNVVPLKGSSIQLVCSISDFATETQPVSWYRTDTKQVVGSGEQTQCLATACTTILRQGYTFTSDNSGMYIDITGLSQSRDGKWWTCRSGQGKALQLVVYTVPHSIQYESVPTLPQDLSVNNVSLKCQTDCAYPAPTVYWYYTENGASRQQYFASGVARARTDVSCTDSEKIYSSTLTLAHYTAFSGNVDKTVRFQCGIPSFPGLTATMYTPFSPEITFAVNVTSVNLTDGLYQSSSSSTIAVTRGITKTLTCYPASSRPEPTIVWYIAGAEKQRSASTNYTFIPSDNDHGKQIYCKAFNIPPESQAVFSDRPKLYVQFPPDIDAVLSSDIHKENSSVTVRCKATGRPATYTYTALEQTWRGTVIPNTHSHLAGNAKYSSLALTSLQLQDTGYYTCHINNGVRDRCAELDQTGTVYVKVEVSPKILGQQTIVYGSPGESLNISVPFYSYPVAEQVDFSRQGGDPIQNDNRFAVSNRTAPVMTEFYGTDVTLDGHIAILQISNLEVLDFANYTLIVANSIGTNAHSFMLRIERHDSVETSSSPVGGIVGGVIAAVIVIVIIAILLVLLRRRHSNKGSKTPKTSQPNTDEPGLSTTSLTTPPGGLYMDLNAEKRADTYDVIHNNEQGHPGSSQYDDGDYLHPVNKTDANINYENLTETSQGDLHQAYKKDDNITTPAQGEKQYENIYNAENNTNDQINS